MGRRVTDGRGRVTLLDANVLIAWVVEDHEHHDLVVRWLAASDGRVALCPITEGALVRHLLRSGESGRRAVRLLTELYQLDRVTMWPADVSLTGLTGISLQGHRQVTDDYLALLAASHQGRLATLDRALAGRHPDTAVLIAVPA